MRPTRIYVDSNIFVRAFEGSDEIAAKLQELLVREHGPPAYLATSELTLAEVLSGAFSDENEILVSTYDNWMYSGPRLQVGPVTRDALYFAAAMRARYPGLKLPDALHLASAIGMNCSHFLTFDKRVSGSYTLVNERHGISSHSQTIDVLRPDMPILRSLLEDASQ